MAGEFLCTKRSKYDGKLNTEPAELWTSCSGKALDEVNTQKILKQRYISDAAVTEQQQRPLRPDVVIKFGSVRAMKMFSRRGKKSVSKVKSINVLISHSLITCFLNRKSCCWNKYTKLRS